ncbi:unnamed protein product [Staurois parvus]|uniref:Uncharacterized protein n=1 Tax=Staurois parvus TaxID=386267 RepID=A0ABN9E059_9NEOB|nr:unnamed protein product [Staurois parvus]
MSLLKFLNFPPVPSRRSHGTEPERRMLASARGYGRGCCREDIVGAQEKVSAGGIPEQRCSVFPSVVRGYRLWY